MLILNSPDSETTGSVRRFGGSAELTVEASCLSDSCLQKLITEKSPYHPFLLGSLDIMV